MSETTTALAARQDTAVAIPYADMERMAVAIAKSQLFGMKTPEQALVLMLLAQAEGRHPVTAARDYHIIENRPSLKADTILARFLAAGGKVEWHEHSDEIASATFSHAQGGTVKLDWNIDRAKRAGLLGKQNWQKYPRSMLRARLVSDGVRTVCPGVFSGLYTPEEIMDGDLFADEPQTGAAAGASHMQAQWDDNPAPAAETAKAEKPAEKSATKVTVEVKPKPLAETEKAETAKPPSRKARVKTIALELGLMPDQIQACLFKLGWPTVPADLTEEQFEALCTTHLQEWVKNPGPKEADWG